MMYLNERDVELIYDTISKAAILRRSDEVIYLDGPFSNYLDATIAARKYLQGQGAGEAALA